MLNKPFGANGDDSLIDEMPTESFVDHFTARNSGLSIVTELDIEMENDFDDEAPPPACNLLRHLLKRLATNKLTRVR